MYARTFSGEQGLILSVAKQTGTPSHNPHTTLFPSNPMIRVAVLHLSCSVSAPCTRLNSIRSPTAYSPLKGAAFLTNALCTLVEQSSAANAPRQAPRMSMSLLKAISGDNFSDIIPRSANSCSSWMFPGFLGNFPNTHCDGAKPPLRVPSFKIGLFDNAKIVISSDPLIF